MISLGGIITGIALYILINSISKEVKEYLKRKKTKQNGN